MNGPTQTPDHMVAKIVSKIDSHFKASGHLESETIEIRNRQADEFPGRTKKKLQNVMLHLMMH